jgi:hypothetical protein
MKKFFLWLADFLSDDESPDEPHYDPVHLGATVVVTIFAIAALFWLLWCLLVFGGGIEAKIIPVLQVAARAKTLADFGYVGYPYEMGVFEGWPTNLIALLILLALIAAVWSLIKEPVLKTAPHQFPLPRGERTKVRVEIKGNGVHEDKVQQ